MIIIDSNIWIFGEIANAPEHDAAVKAYESMVENDTIATNAIIISEVFHKLSRLFDRDTAYSRVINILQNPSIEWLEIGRDTSISAVRLAKNAQIKINDALIARQALEADAKLFTDDSDFKKIKGLKILSFR
jgi:predicted nucleic acid-binding protein